MKFEKPSSIDSTMHFYLLYMVDDKMTAEPRNSIISLTSYPQKK